MQLERFEQNGLELLIDLKTGAVFASQNALVRMTQTPETTLRAFSRSNNLGNTRVKIPTVQGMKMARLYNEDEIYVVFERFQPSLLVQCAKCGLRVYLHQLAGFQVTSTAIQQQDSTQDLLLRVLANQEAQAQYFNAQIAEMRAEMQQQNEKLMLLLPDHETMNTIREAVVDLRNIKPILEAIAKSLKENPTQEKHPLKHYLGNKNCSRGLRIQIGQMVSNWMSLSQGFKLGKINEFQNKGVTLYPECVAPLIVLAWQVIQAG